MLHQVGLAHTICPPDGFDEDALKASLEGTEPQHKALELAKGKAEFVSKQHPEALVLAADQICALGSTIFSKPATTENAIAQLRQLRGKTHQQFSAVCIYENGVCIWEHVGIAQLTMRLLSEAEIEAYIERDQPLASCGAYMFEKMGKHLFTEVHGTDDVIQGLPLVPLLHALYDMGKISL